MNSQNNDDNNELKKKLMPCPFCGAEEGKKGLVFGEHISVRDDHVAIVCIQCYMSGPQVNKEHRFSKDQAVRLWNARKS